MAYFQQTPTKKYKHNHKNVPLNVGPRYARSCYCVTCSKYDKPKDFYNVKYVNTGWKGIFKALWMKKKLETCFDSKGISVSNCLCVICNFSRIIKSHAGYLRT
jgi:hypothetical protein